MKISKKDALMWFSFFAALLESRDACPRYMVSMFCRTSSRAVVGTAGALSPVRTPES